MLGALSTLLVGACTWPYTVDDAFIVGRYASRIASGLGYTFSAGAASDGITGPLWLVPGLVLGRFGVDPVVAQKLVGLSCMGLAVWLVLRRVGARQLGTRALGFSLPLCALQPTLGSWGSAGLETGAATLSLSVAALAATARPVVRPWAAGSALGLSAWLRPELALAGLVLGTTMLARDRARGLRALGVVLVCVCALLAFRVLYLGTWLPLAYHAKPGELAAGFEYVVRAVVLSTGVSGIAVAAHAWWRGRIDDRVVLVLLCAHVLAVCLAGGDWMPGFRLLAPVLPLYLGLVASVAARLSLTRSGCVLASGACALACLVTTLDLVTRVPQMREAGASRERVGSQLAQRLRVDATRAAMVDVGYFGYASGIDVIDLGGVTDSAIARMPGGHLDKRVPSRWLEQRAPDALVVHSASEPTLSPDGSVVRIDAYPVEQRVLRMPWVRRRFRVADSIRYAPGYHYVLLLPRVQDRSRDEL